MSKLIATNKEADSNISTRIEMMQQARRIMIDKKNNKAY